MATTTVDTARPTISKMSLLSLEATYPSSPEETTKARDRVNRVAKVILPTSNSTVASVYTSMSHKQYAEVPGLDTAAVACGADRQPVMILNPPFINSLDTDQCVAAVLAHECLHDVLMHLNGALEYPGMTDRSREHLRIAEDTMINYLIIQLGFSLPTQNGETIGIQPTEMYRWVRDKMKADPALAPLIPPSLNQFCKSEKVIFDLLELLPDNRQKGTKSNWCARGESLGEDGDQSGPGGPGDPTDQLPRDAAAIGSIMDQALENAVKDAVANGNERAKKEIEVLLDATEGSETAQKLWGQLGAYAVRGTAPKTGAQSRDWYRWTEGFVGTRVAAERSREMYNQQIPWDPRISPVGRGRRKTGVIGIDVSGSMPQTWVDSFLNRLGRAFPDLELKAVAWDGKAELLEAGGTVHGGGGTRFECFDDWIADNMMFEPDFILTVTDGFFAKPVLRFTPRLYGWLIIPGGDAFMKRGYTPDGTGRHVPPMMTFELTALTEPK